MEIIANTNTELLKKQAGEQLSKMLSSVSNSPTLLLLSGGSALEILPYVLLPENAHELTIMMLDERFSKQKEENNFFVFSKTDFYTRAREAGAVIINTESAEEKTVEALAKKMSDTLTNWKKNNPRGSVIATLGIGADGHTAGIMPYPENTALFETLFNDGNKWVVGYDASGKNSIPLRATVTLPFLKDEIDQGIAYVTGSSKHNALERAIADTGSLPETPARIFRDMKNLSLYTDMP
jgi:6-phosphogluconolactonase/glucosamine-6-phosphate isomerase/deaminase